MLFLMPNQLCHCNESKSKSTIKVWHVSPQTLQFQQLMSTYTSDELEESEKDERADDADAP